MAQVFDKWEITPSVTFELGYDAARNPSRFKMPASNVQATPSYKDDTVIIDGKEYPTVTIGNRVWTAKDSYHMTRRSAMNMADPLTGWRLPTLSDWQNLFSMAGGKGSDGGPPFSFNSGGSYYSSGSDKLKSKQWNGTDDFGFGALPSGLLNIGAQYDSISSEGDAFWWTSHVTRSSTGVNSRETWYGICIRSAAGALLYLTTEQYPERYGMKVRFVKNLQLLIVALLMCLTIPAKALGGGQMIFDKWEIDPNITFASGTSVSSNPAKIIMPSRDIAAIPTYKEDDPLAAMRGTAVIGGKEYATIRIGTQVWMAENLDYPLKASIFYNNYSRYYNGASSPPFEKAGLLYSVGAIGISNAISTDISGWVVPTSNDWKKLFNYVGENPGTKLKSKTGWINNGNGTDDFGFNGKPAGYYEKVFLGLNERAMWFTRDFSQSRASNTAILFWHYSPGYNTPQVDNYQSQYAGLASVRLIKG